MNDPLNFPLLQLCSGHYLCHCYPDDWLELTEAEQNQFVLDNAWQPFENYDADYVISCIDSAAEATLQFLENY